MKLFLRRSLAAFESRPVTALCCVLAVWLAGSLVPFRAATLYASAHEFVFYSNGNSKALIYNNVHGRPFEGCDSERKQRTEMTDRVEARSDRATTDFIGEPRRIFSLLSIYNAEALAFYASPCRVEWKRNFDLFDYAYSFPGATPYIWVISQFHVTEVYVALLLMIGAYLGVLCAFWVGRTLLRSNAGGLLVLAGLMFTIRFFGYGQNGLLYLLNSFPLICAGQLLASPAPSGARWSTRHTVAIALFALFSIVTLFTAPIPSKMNPLVIVVSVAIVAVIRRDLRCATRAAVLALVLMACRYPYLSSSGHLLSAVSSLNSGQSEEFLPVTMVGYTFERPGYWGFVFGDGNYGWVLDRDPLLRNYVAPAVFHGFRPWSNTFFVDALLHRPWLLPLNWYGRLVEAIGFHEFTAFHLYCNGHCEGTSTQAIGTRVFWIALAILLLCCLSRRDDFAIWPVAAVCLFELFGVNVFQGITHTHALYFARGVALLWSVLPACVVLSLIRWRGISSTVSGGARWTRRRMPTGRWSGIAVALIVTALGWVLVQQARREARVFRIWTRLDYGLFFPEYYITHDQLDNELTELRRLGSLEPGAVSMYAANMMWFQYGGLPFHKNYLKGKLPIDFDKEAEECRQSAARYYAQALAEAPNNPHYYAHAEMLGAPNWVDIFNKAVMKFPHHPYRAMMLLRLASAGGHSQYFPWFAASMGEFYEQTARYRPGYKRLPRVDLSSTTRAHMGPHERGVWVALDMDAEARLEPVSTHRTDRMNVLVYTEVLSGVASVCLETSHGCSKPLSLVPNDWMPYHVLDSGVLSNDDAFARVRVTSRAPGTAVVIRDLYPLVENPRAENYSQ